MVTSLDMSLRLDSVSVTSIGGGGRGHRRIFFWKKDFQVGSRAHPLLLYDQDSVSEMRNKCTAKYVILNFDNAKKQKKKH